MNSEPKLSVIIPIYNAEKYLNTSLKTILDQSFTDFELICVNDGSIDGSLSILKNFSKKDNRIKIVNQNNSGAAAARNRGIRMAKGEALMILDADDIFNKNLFEVMYDELSKSKTDIVICQFNIFDQLSKNFCSSRKLPNKDLINKTIDPKSVKKRIFQITNAACWNKIFRKEFIIKNKIFFKHFETIDDLFFTFLSLALSDKFKIISQTLITYRVKTNLSQTDKIKISVFNSLQVFTNLKKELKIRNKLVFFKQSLYLAKLESLLWMIKKILLS